MIVDRNQGIQDVHVRTPAYKRYVGQYHIACLPDAEWQRCKLEQLRYKWRYANAIDIQWRLMQRLGDVGRKFFPFIGRGWNGIGGK